MIPRGGSLKELSHVLLFCPTRLSRAYNVVILTFLFLTVLHLSSSITSISLCSRAGWSWRFLLSCITRLPNYGMCGAIEFLSVLHLFRKIALVSWFLRAGWLVVLCMFLCHILPARLLPLYIGFMIWVPLLLLSFSFFLSTPKLINYRELERVVS